MTTYSEPRAATHERLSALVDGELDPATAAQACGHWRDDAASRATWHAYHLIGDVLRSDDLACDPALDAGFLLAFRARLASDPVVLALPTVETASFAAAPVAARAAHRRWVWLGPPALAAGFVALAGMLLLARAPVEPIASPGIAAASTDRAAPVVSAAVVTDPQTFVADGQLIRDSRLDRYLAAHKQFAGSSALGVPSAFLRNATADAANR